MDSVLGPALNGIRVGREPRGARPIYGSTMIFLGKKLEGVLVWALTCKGCGERYVTREIKAGEVTYEPNQEVIRCHETNIAYEYNAREFRTVWAP